MESISGAHRRARMRFLPAGALAGIVAVSLLLAGCASLPKTSAPPPSACRSIPLAGVYRPWRLHLILPCLTVSGVVEHVQVEPDHDWHVNLRLDPGQPHLANWVNGLWKRGDLVLEVIPMDQAEVPKPSVGEHITATGAYVLDLVHGWREIHPVWEVNGVGSAGSPPRRRGIRFD